MDPVGSGSEPAADDLVGRRVRVPDVHDDRPDEYVEGEVIDVHPTDASGPELVVVDVDGDRIALPVTQVRFVESDG